MNRDDKGRFLKPENNRESRSADTRAQDQARKPWAPPSMLETPPAPDGYVYRWIRAEILNDDDKKMLCLGLEKASNSSGLKR